jgi:hypothetical protein
MATIGGFDRQYGYDDAVPPDIYEADKEVARQEWQAAVNAYEDGLSDVEPVEWKEFWG